MVSADAALAVTAVAASAAAPFINLRRLRDGLLGKVSALVMISSHEFLLGGKHVPAIRHNAGELRVATSDSSNSCFRPRPS
jgi:hypothetical protein